MRIKKAHLWAMGRITLAVVLLFVIFKYVIPLWDTVHLSDGTVLCGTFTNETDGEIRVDTVDGQRVVLAEDIAVDKKGQRRVARGFIPLLKEMAPRRYLVGLMMLAWIPLLAALRWRTLMKAQGIPMTYLRAVELTYLGLFCNNFMPGLTGGDVAKAYYATKLTSTKKTSAVVTVFLDRLIGLVMMGWIAGAAVCVTLVFPVGPQSEKYIAAAWIIAGFMVCTLVGGIVFFSRRMRGYGVAILQRIHFLKRLAEVALVEKAIHVVRRIDSAIFLYRNRKRALFYAAIISLMAHSSAITGVFMFGRALHVSTINLVNCFVVVPVAFMVSSIPVAPAGWGIGEMAFRAFFAAVGVAATAAVTISVVYRLSQALCTLPGGLIIMLQKDRPTFEEAGEEVQEDLREAEDVIEAG